MDKEETTCGHNEKAACSGCPFSRVLASRWGGIFMLGLIATAVARVYAGGIVADGLFVASLLFALAVIAVMFGVSEKISKWRRMRYKEAKP